METKILKIQDIKKDVENITLAAEIIKGGGLVAMPTETVYGLFANALNGAAVSKIFKAKGRPQDNPLIVHIEAFDDIYRLAKEVPEKAVSLARAFWPGPLTLVLPKKDVVPQEISRGLDTVAIRMPLHEIARAVIKKSGLPLAAPSANISGFPSPTAVQHVIDDMTGRIDAIVDGGESSVGIESTVLSLAGDTPLLLRPGSITQDDIESIIGEITLAKSILSPMAHNEKAQSPGMKHRHYAPRADIAVIDASYDEYVEYINKHKAKGVFALCFVGQEKDLPVKAVTMGYENDSLSQANRLFDAFRELDALGAKRVYALCPSRQGIGLAVCNRLFRAASFEILKPR